MRQTVPNDRQFSPDTKYQDADLISRRHDIGPGLLRLQQLNKVLACKSRQVRSMTGCNIRNLMWAFLETPTVLLGSGRERVLCAKCVHETHPLERQRAE
jgi:hypothetical protein